MSEISPLMAGSNPIHHTGVGLRSCHFQHILKYRPNIPWFEALTDNYLVDGGPPLHYLMAIREQYPMTLHGVGLSLGSTDPLNTDYLNRLIHLTQQVQPAYVSDHLTWSSVNQRYLHDLLPLPFTEEAIHHVAQRIQHVQDQLGQRILVENASRYLHYECSEMTEWAFLNAVAEAADCYILLDINNIYVTAFNLNFNPMTYIEQVIPSRIKQYHLAGHSQKTTYLFDDHGSRVTPEVWNLYEKALNIIGPRPTLIEWDDHIPEFSVLAHEAARADQYLRIANTSQRRIANPAG